MNTRGFTIIEMLVATAIFSFVMVIALGALLSISVSDRKAETLKSVINNLNFSLDSMSRSIRTGSNWGCDTTGTTAVDCAAGGNEVLFTPSSGVGQVYYKLENVGTDGLSNAQSACGQTGADAGCILRSTDGGLTWLPITAPEVIINNTTPLFYMVGSPRGAADPLQAQPKLIIGISGYVIVSGGVSSASGCNSAGNTCTLFHLQTTVTQRLYDQ